MNDVAATNGRDVGIWRDVKPVTTRSLLKDIQLDR